MNRPRIVSLEEWLAACWEHLAREKEFTGLWDRFERRAARAALDGGRQGVLQLRDAYSCCARGTDLLTGVYNYLDLVPKGRDEAGLPWTMAGVWHHDRYGERAVADLASPADRPGGPMEV